MSALGWLALVGPLAAFAVGWAFGWGYHRETIGKLNRTIHADQAQLASLRAQVGLLSSAPLDDDRFDELLEAATQDGPDGS